jgi:uncharacterized membrane protein (UPF0136 family)
MAHSLGYGHGRFPLQQYDGDQKESEWFSNRKREKNFVAAVTIVFGAVLIVLGLLGYFTSESRSITALIPAFFGIVFSVLGVLGRQDSLRKHVMHGAAALALIGFIIPAVMGIPKLITFRWGGDVKPPNAAIFQTVMAALCAVFLGLCIRSFIMARRARMQNPKPS